MMPGFPKIAPLPATLAALSLAACGMAGAATIGTGSPGLARPVATAAPAFACTLRMRPAPGGGTVLQAEVTAARAMSGIWDLAVTQSGGGGSAVLSQDGRFRLAGGEALVLSDMALSGPARAIAATLTIAHEGRETRCPVTGGGS
jgi:hypothetical protein